MTKSPRGARLAIVNPLTLVGEEIRTILGERGIEMVKVDLLDSTGNSVGALTEVGDEPAFVQPVTADAFADLDIALFCGTPESNVSWIDRYDADHFIAIDLSQPSLLVHEGPALVAGVNLDLLQHDPRLIISPHPITVALSVLLAAIDVRSTVDLAVASVIQPASEFNQAGIDELFAQTTSVLNLKKVPKEIFDRQLAFNLYPAPEGKPVERYIGTQLRQLLRKDLAVTVSITQGTIFHGHTLSLFIRTRDETASAEMIRDALRSTPEIRLTDEDDFSSTVEAAGNNEIIVARVSEDAEIRGGFWIWAACDNLRRGSALNAVLIVEAILAGSTSQPN